MPRCDDGRHLVTTSSLFRPLHPLAPHRMFRWSAPPRIVVQVAQRRRRSALPQRLVSVHATPQPLVQCPTRPAGRKCRRWVRRQYPRPCLPLPKTSEPICGAGASTSDEHYPTMLELTRNHGRNTAHNPRCGRPSVRRSEYDTYKPRSRRRRKQHALHTDGKSARPRRRCCHAHQENLRMAGRSAADHREEPRRPLIFFGPRYAHGAADRRLGAPPAPMIQAWVTRRYVYLEVKCGE